MNQPLRKPEVKRKVFFSFHFDGDFWRTQQVRQIGVIEGDTPVSSNKWEEVKNKGDSAVKKWIDDNLENKSCLILLIGKDTAGRKWIDYEIVRAWEKGKGVLGIRIHNLEDQNGKQSSAGKDPFAKYTLCDKKLRWSNIIKIVNPPQITGKGVYKDISDNLKAWIDESIKIRKEFKCPQ